MSPFRDFFHTMRLVEQFFQPNCPFLAGEKRILFGQRVDPFHFQKHFRSFKKISKTFKQFHSFKPSAGCWLGPFPADLPLFFPVLTLKGNRPITTHGPPVVTSRNKIARFNTLLTFSSVVNSSPWVAICGAIFRQKVLECENKHVKR